MPNDHDSDYDNDEDDDGDDDMILASPPLSVAICLFSWHIDDLHD